MIQTGKLIADRYVVQNSPNINPGQQVIFEAYQEKELFKLGIVEQVTAETIQVRDEKDSIYTRNHEEVYQIKMDILETVTQIENNLEIGQKMIAESRKAIEKAKYTSDYFRNRLLPGLTALGEADSVQDLKSTIIALREDLTTFVNKFETWK